MPYTSDSVTRRSIGPALGSAVVGITLGIVAVIGIAQFSGQDAISESSVPAEDALLGGPEYGTRG